MISRRKPTGSNLSLGFNQKNSLTVFSRKCYRRTSGNRRGPLVAALQANGPLAENRVWPTGSHEVVISQRLPVHGKPGWIGATLVFSDGQKEIIELKNISGPQKFSFPKKKSDSIMLTDFQQAFPLETNGITEWEVFGTHL